ncbi:hypothetical protein E6Q11_01415 [Candidatus Dojkabacteria bacterium]|uniref:HEPN domain-containing protein n=1 Tax=Candidatus Dojkabacteria bacterium TaxID=2099670 RepID=A0A5C7JA45_9BACT|nr:MAG: hypothetical protein E6Q11_01415 [Candidatus Dojkabacteria bacterium]
MGSQILSIDAVMSAMVDYANAQKEHDAARESYEGYSWGWAGESYIEAVDRARDATEKVLEQYIDACVQRAINKLKDSTNE